MVKFQIIHSRIRHPGTPRKYILPFHSLAVKRTEICLRCGISPFFTAFKRSARTALKRTVEHVVCKIGIRPHNTFFGQYPDFIVKNLNFNNIGLKFSFIYQSVFSEDKKQLSR